MGKLKIKFHPLFALYVFVCIYFNWFNKIFYYVIVVTMHEYGHYFCAKYYGYQMDSIIYSLSGAGITTNSSFKSKHDIIISLCGPLVNLILIVVTICLWWIFPLSYLYTYDFLICNIVVMMFNLLPLYPLDGGRIIVSILCLKGKNRNKCLRINKIVCLTFGILFVVLFLISIFFKTNYNLLITSMFLLVNAITSDKNIYFDKIKSLNKNNDKPIEVKVFKVSTHNKKELVKYLNPYYFSVFKNELDGKTETINETDLLK